MQLQGAELALQEANREKEETTRREDQLKVVKMADTNSPPRHCAGGSMKSRGYNMNVCHISVVLGGGEAAGANTVPWGWPRRRKEGAHTNKRVCVCMTGDWPVFGRSLVIAP